MVTLKQAFELCHIGNREVVYFCDNAKDKCLSCTPMTGAEVRQKYDMKNTLVSEIDMHGLEEVNGFTFVISRKPGKPSTSDISKQNVGSEQPGTDAWHVQILYRDGYHAAAKRFEQLMGSVSREAEYKYLLSYVEQSRFDDDECEDCFRILWTAYCLHHNLDVDTAPYDNDLLNLWNKMEETGNTGEWEDYNNFDGAMIVSLRLLKATARLRLTTKPPGMTKAGDSALSIKRVVLKKSAKRKLPKR